MDGLRLALEVEFDLVILDVMIPSLDGWGVLMRLRQAGRQTPVLFLTARDAIHERVRGLELGADDYLVKPFAFSELLARCGHCCAAGRNGCKKSYAWPIWRSIYGANMSHARDNVWS